MKLEDNEKGPRLNLAEPEGVRSQGNAEDVEWVLTDAGNFRCAPHSFHYYFTKSKDGSRGVPFIQFDIADSEPGGLPNPMAGKRIEIVNIASIVGIVYKPVD